MRNQILTLLALSLSAGAAAAAEYRGMPAGWPYSGGYYASYTPANYGAPGVVYAARPVTVAYANPAYLAAYGNTATAYRPTVAAAGYYQQPTTAYYVPAYGTAPPYSAASAAAYYQPQTAYYAPAYAPQTVQYAPSQSYAISPAGGVSAGSEAAAYYGQPTALNYVPPQFNYRTTYAQVPVYMYRPVTAYYQPAAVQPTTCLQPATTSTCVPQRTRSWFSWLHPHNWGHSWFGGRSSCGYSGCGSPPPTTAYCTTNYCQPPCGTQPYYPVPVQPAPAVIPTVPAQPQTTIPLTPYPSTTIPSTTIPSVPSAGPRVPSPPTRSPADVAPRLQTSPVPATTVPSTPGSSPPGSFTPSPGSLQPSPGGFTPGGSGSFPTAPSSSIQGGGSRSSTVSAPSTTSAPASESPVIRAPELNPPLPPSVKIVPDLDAQQPVAPINRAPLLLSPRDKTAARNDRRWAVVPAVWPSDAKNAAARPVMQTNAAERASPAVAQPKADRYDDSGWTSGRAW